jgi:hypothetical protein
MNVLVKRIPIFMRHVYKASVLNDQMLGEGGPANGVQDPLGVAEQLFLGTLEKPHNQQHIYLVPA